MRPYLDCTRLTLSDVRNRMLHAGDEIVRLHARARMKFFGEYYAPERGSLPGPLRLWGPDDMAQPSQILEAWWVAPDHWRHDSQVAAGPRQSYRMIGDQWALWQGDTVQATGTMAQARDQHLTARELLTYGRPYLTPAENAHLWLWLNPAIWVASFGLVLDNHYYPLLDDLYDDDQIVHVLAGHGVGSSVFPGWENAALDQWSIQTWDRDQELTDFANFHQLWVDMRTGFCRRMTAEGSNGRQWDILVDVLELNGPLDATNPVFDLARSR
jgi:hypothetical protein